MYKLVMIDDEDAVLYNLSNSFEWEKIGFSVAGLFNNVFDFFEYLKCNHVDVVLTDINMPDMDGIELAVKMRDLYPDVLVILISGYKYFEYAQKAISAGVFSYLLKPLNYGKVLDEFARVRNELIRREALVMDKRSETGDEQDLCQNVSDYMHGYTEIHGIGEFIGHPAAVMDITIDEFDKFLHDSWKYGTERLYNAVGRMMKADGIFFVPMDRMFGKMSYIAITKTLNKTEFESKLKCLEKQISTDCLDLLELIAILRTDRIYSTLAHLRENETRISYIKSTICWIFDLAESGNGNDALKILNTVITTLDEELQCDFEEEIKKVIEMRISAENIKNYDIYPTHIIQQDNKKQVGIYLYEMVRNVCRYYSDNSEDDEKGIFKNVIAYIDEHYMEKLSLDEVADSVFMSKYHFCRVFKRIMKINFVDYLNKVRIEKAQKLLAETDMKINEIYSAVGYSGLKYFHKKFKQITGLTPQGYRKLSLKK